MVWRWISPCSQSLRVFFSALRYNYRPYCYESFRDVRLNVLQLIGGMQSTNAERYRAFWCCQSVFHRRTVVLQLKGAIGAGNTLIERQFAAQHWQVWEDYHSSLICVYRVLQTRPFDVSQSECNRSPRRGLKFERSALGPWVWNLHL